MTRDELRKHCEKTVETQLRYKNSTNGLEQFHSKKVLSEHQLILELLDAEAKWLSVIEKIELKLQSEISRMEEIERTCDYKRPHTLDWVLKLIEDEVKEIKDEG